jgi:hypothetical protein
MHYRSTGALSNTGTGNTSRLRSDSTDCSSRHRRNHVRVIESPRAVLVDRLAADLGVLRGALKLICPDTDWPWFSTIIKRIASTTKS